MTTRKTFKDIREDMRLLALDADRIVIDDEAINQISSNAYYVDYVDHATNRVYIKDKFNTFSYKEPANAV